MDDIPITVAVVEDDSGMRHALQRIAERAEVGRERRPGIDEAGCAALLGDARERHALGVQLAVVRMEGAHGAAGLRSTAFASAGAAASAVGALGGGVSGPLMPQDAVASAIAKATRGARAGRRK